MKRLLRWLLGALAAVLVLVVLLLVFKDTLLTAFARHRIAKLTGMTTELKRVHLGLTTATLVIEGLRLHNPPDFGGGIFLDLPELRLELAADALVNQRLHLARVRVNFAELNIVENADGVRNVDRLQPRRPPAPTTRPPGPASPKPDRPSSKLEFGAIDTLDLTLGRVRFISHKHPRASRELVMDIHGLELKDVRSAADLSAVLFAVALKNSAGLLAGDWRAPFRWWRELADGPAPPAIPRDAPATNLPPSPPQP